MQRVILRSLLIFSFLFCLYYSLSQKEDKTTYQLLFSISKRADSFYNAASFLNNSIKYTEQKENELNSEALLHYRQLILRAPISHLYDSLRFFSAFHIGELEHYFENFSEAVNGYNQAIRIKLNSRLPDSLLFQPYLYCGIIYYNQNKYDSAMLYFQNAEKIQLKYNYKLTESERLYNTFGVLYYQKGDYKQAKNYFLKAIEILPASNEYYKELLLTYNINLAQIYFKLEDYDRSNEIYQKLLASNPPDKNIIYHNVGLINLYLGAAGKALDYFKKVNYGSSNKVILLYENIGEAFYNLQKFDSARFYFEKAIAISHRFGSNTDLIGYGKALRSLGDLELHFNLPQEALANYQAAIHQFYPAFTNDSVRSNPEKFTGLFSYINLFNTLLAKADAFHKLYKNSSTIEWAKEELKTYQSAFQLIDYVERTYNSDEARLFLNKIKYAVHSKPIDIAFLLYSKTGDKRFLENLYMFDQRNKASVLTAQTQLTEKLSGKDSSIVNKERSIRTDITRLSLQAAQINDSGQLSRINNTIRDKEIELGRMQEQLPDEVIINQIPSVSFLQKKLLDDKTALISFHLSDSGLTTLLITQEAFDCFQQKFFEGFQDTINEYINSLKIPSLNASTDESIKISNFLFRHLDLSKINRLIIIPDDELNYLSFEGLKDINGEYLIKKYAIQYQYSTALLKKETINFSQHETLSFAPFAQKSFEDSFLRLSTLPNSVKEINGLRGRQFSDSSATKRNFLINLSKYNVLHLATHAIVNNGGESQSFVSFYPSSNTNPSEFLLYTEEVYNLPLNKTRLVILSACETGSGNLIKGEGIMSLSRAFAYAGCSNIITSLWSANDFSTAYITNRVHYYLDKKYSIADALRQAKLDYLNDKSVNPRLKHPFYWSHLVFIGNYTPAEKSGGWWLFAAVAVTIIALFVIIKKKASQKRSRAPHK